MGEMQSLNGPGFIVVYRLSTSNKHSCTNVPMQLLSQYPTLVRMLNSSRRKFIPLNIQLKHIPHICHGRHGRRPCNFFLAGVNFYRFNAKNWYFRQILREKVAFFYRFNAKIGVFRCKFYSPKILPV